MTTVLMPRCSSVIDASFYAHTLLEDRCTRAFADMFRVHRDKLKNIRGGCMVRVFPTDYTKELKQFSERDPYVSRCIDTLHKRGLNSMEMFVEGLVRNFGESCPDECEDEDAELQEIDKLREDFDVALSRYLDECIRDSTLNIIRYGFTPLGYKNLDGEKRNVPYVPRDFVIARLQPSGEYLCQGIDQQVDPGPFELFFFNTPTDDERPNSDLSKLLPLYNKLVLLYQAHDRSLEFASRPYIVTVPVQDNKDRDATGTLDEEKREREKTKLRQHMLREQVNQGTTTALRLAELAAVMSTDDGVVGIGGGEELSGSGFLASAMKRTHQEMTDKLFRLKNRYRKDVQTLREKTYALEDFIQKGCNLDAVGLPVRYQLPEGSSHVDCHLNVRPNALGYDMFVQTYQVEVTRAILGEPYSSKKIKEVETRQGLSRALMAATSDIDDDRVSAKCIMLQRFLVQNVLRALLNRDKIPMAPLDQTQKAMGLQRFHFMDRILRKRRMKLWLMCNTGHRAADITMKYRENDPYRTGQAVAVPQPVVPIATAQGDSVCSKCNEIDSDTDDDDDDDDDESGHGRRIKRGRH